MRFIDINCDLGEGFGIYRLAPEIEIFPLITSANIACGFHAGDPQVMRQSVAWALQYKVAIGAHPGTPDLAGFGRRAMELSLTELENLLIYQIGSLEAFCKVAGTHVSHVKPHGWLYNAAASNAPLADSIVGILKTMNSSWILYGLAGSELTKAARRAGLHCAEEAFIDRAYEPDGSLTKRSLEGSLITDAGVAARQALDLALKGTVRSRSGIGLRVAAETLCVHGDNPAILQILRQVRRQFSQNGVEVRPCSPPAGEVSGH
jgi:5-oxoprolinase (ATP-hydrolysing) subunit A